MYDVSTSYLEYDVPSRCAKEEVISLGDANHPEQVVNSRRLTSICKPESPADEVNSNKKELSPSPSKRKKYRMLRRQPARIFDCSECGKTFKHPSKIAEHMRVHTGEKPFRCVLCGAAFTQGNPLKVHMRVHRGERPYVCDYCGRTFSTSSQKRSHERTHLKKQFDVELTMFVCPVEDCGARYSHKERMAIHIETCHEELGEVVTDGEEKKMIMDAVDDLMERDDGADGAHDDRAWQQQPSQPHYYSEVVVDQDASSGVYEQVGEVGSVLAVVQGHAMDGLQNAVGANEFVGSEVAGSVLSTAVELEDDEVGEMFVAGEEIVEESSDEHIPVFQYFPSEEPYFAPNEGATVIEELVIENVKDGDVIEDGEEILVEEGALMQSGHISIVDASQCEFVDVGDGTISPTIEEEVETIDCSYVEVEESVRFTYLPVDVNRSSLPVVTRNRRRIKRLEQGLIAGTHHVEMEPCGGSDPEGGSGGRRRDRRPIVADPRPPRKGRRRPTDNVESYTVEVDPSIFEMAAPLKKPRGVTERLVYAEECVLRPARNLDWIIDAVARGDNVDDASPHNRRKPQIHRCEYCGRIDKYPSKIKAHMRTHTGEKPFECEICGMCFAQRTPMRMHVRRHLNQKPYVCDVNGCGERFINGSLLNAHQNTKHFGRKRFVCMRGCGRSFAQSRNQRKHEESCMFNANSPDEFMEREEEQEGFCSGSAPRGDSLVRGELRNAPGGLDENSHLMEARSHHFSHGHSVSCDHQPPISTVIDVNDRQPIAQLHQEFLPHPQPEEKILMLEQRSGEKVRLNDREEIANAISTDGATLEEVDLDVVGEDRNQQPVPFSDTRQLVSEGLRVSKVRLSQSF